LHSQENLNGLLHSQENLYPSQENLNGWLSCMQACPLLLGLAAQHNKITAFPAVLACLLLRMLNLNGNRYPQPVCNAMHSCLGTHPLLIGICALTLYALAYHDQHAVWQHHQHPLSLHDLRTINSVTVWGKHLVLPACAHSVMSSRDHACMQTGCRDTEGSCMLICKCCAQDQERFGDTLVTTPDPPQASG